MKEKTLLKIALVCSLAGLVLLFFISQRISITETEISKINKENIEQDVKVSGIVTSVINLENVMILEVGQVNTMKVVVFKDKEFNINEGDYVEVTGGIDEYEGSLEIVADEIRVR